MSRVKRRSPSRRTPNQFANISRGELVRWSIGQILIEGDYFPGVDPDPNVTVWPDWSTWAKTYQRCRREFLDSRRQQSEPVSERLFAVLRADGDINAELELIRLENIESDPRKVLLDPAYMSGKGQQQPATSMKKGKK